MDADRPAKFLLIQTRLGADLAEHIEQERAVGRSYRSIAAALTSVTQVAVSHESLRTWDRQPGVAA